MTDHPAPNPNQPDALVERITFALHDADCPDRKCEPHVMGRYRRTAERVAAVLPEVERRAGADALREAAEDFLYNADVDAPLPGYADLHARADQIEKGDRA